MKSKILLYDLELTPNKGYIWGKYEQNVLGRFIEERKIISIAWKWYKEADIDVETQRTLGFKRPCATGERELIKAFLPDYAQADMIVAHNGDGYDEKQLNTAIVTHKLAPPPPHKSIDTLKVARKNFRFNSNKLSDLGIALGLGDKVKHSGFSMWEGCMNGVDKDWEDMRTYNIGDIVLLESVYTRFLPWIKNHPNRSLYEGQLCCPSCGEKDYQQRGTLVTQSGPKIRFQCQASGCGRWFQDASTKTEKRVK